MSFIDDAILAPAEGAFNLVGLRTPAARGVASAAATFGALYWAKPELMFTADGEIRPSSMMSEKEEATPLCIYTASALVGLSVFLFV